LAGRFGASITNLARIAPLAGREISGSAQLQADGRVSTAGVFDLQLNGESTDLQVGIAQLDPLLRGATRVQGGIARDDAGLRFDELALTNERASARVSGSFADPELDLTVAATLADLSSVTERASGSAEVSARVTGTTAEPRIEAEASGAELVLMGRPLSDSRARFAGVVAGPQTAGDAELSGNLDGVPVQGAAQLSAGENGARVLRELLLTVGESRASGNLTLTAENLLSGELNVVSPDLSKVAPLFLVEASGMLRADVKLSAEAGSQSATISGMATDIVYNNVRLDSAELTADARDLFTAPKVDGSFEVRNLTAGGLTVVSVSGTAQREGQATEFAVEAALADGSANVRGTLEPRGQDVAVALQSFAFSRDGLETSLAAPTTVVVEEGTVTLDNARLNAGGGTVTLAGRAGSTLDLTARLGRRPAALANTVRPDLGAQGTISGNVTLTGTASAPAAQFDAALAGSFACGEPCGRGRSVVRER
jgi:translocation and assembly module TamB